MEFPDIWTVMKWVLLVLLAGFIGQFGKTFAQQLMKRFRKEPGTAVGAPEGRGVKAPAVPPADNRPRPELPLAGPPAAPPPPPVGAISAAADKKLLKALAKQKKKEAKALQKAEKG
mgnify:CR=1 FL=1